MLCKQSTFAICRLPHTVFCTSHAYLYAYYNTVIKHYLEKRSLIQKELWTWVREDQNLGAKVNKVCDLFEQLDNRERGSTRSKRKRAANKSNEPIVLDDDGLPAAAALAKSNEPICLDEPQAKKSAAAALKSNETIEIDLSDDNDDGGREEKKEEYVAELNQSANAKSDDGFVDLT